MDRLNFAEVNTEESFKRFVDFAQDFGHNEGDHSLLPAITVSRGDRMFGYFKLITYPIICPAFHPKKTTPRDFSDTVSQVRAWTNINSMSERFPNGTTFIAMENNPAVDVKIINKLGFKNLGIQLWQAGGA